MNWNTLIPLGALLTLITLLVGAFSMAARSLRTTSQAIGELSKTNIDINRENRAMAKDRHETERVHETERAAWKTERVDMQCQLDGVISKLTRVESDFAAYRISSQKVIDELGQELVKVKRELAESRQEALAINNSMQDLTAALTTAQEQVKKLENQQQQWRLDLADAQRKIAVLERDNLAKDHEIKTLTDRVKDLEDKLQHSENELKRLEAEKAELLRLLALVEPGEHTAPVQEPSENEIGKEDRNGLG